MRTPGDWRFEVGGGHAHSRIVGEESVQTNGWLKDIRTPDGTLSNRSYSDVVCTIESNHRLPGPAANIRTIALAGTAANKLDVMGFDGDACLEMLPELVTHLVRFVGLSEIERAGCRAEWQDEARKVRDLMATMVTGKYAEPPQEPAP